jgi:glucose-1-phosphate thymidylyltransferase
MRARAVAMRFVGVLGKGVIVVAPTARSSGPWLDATRATSLQRVGNRPIACHVLDALASAGVVDVALLTPPDLAEEVMHCIDREGPPGMAVRQIMYDEGVETAAALEAVSEFLAGAAAIVHRADGLLGQPLAPLLELLDGEEAPEILLLVAEHARNAERLGPATQRVLRIAELDPMRATLGIAGTCLLAPGVLEAQELAEHSTSPLEPAALAEALIATGDRTVQVGVVHDWRSFAGDTADLLDLNRSVLDALECRSPAQNLDGNRFEGHIRIDATASVTSSVICGPVVVGAGACVADAYIGPHTSIGERVHVEGAEIERSIILAGASILHVGGRLVASVVGRDARIFRDFSVPRAMRLQVGDGDEVALC